MALLFAERSGAVATLAGAGPERLRAEATVVIASCRLGQRLDVVERGIAAIHLAERQSDGETAALLRVELAGCARSAGVPLVGAAILRPVLTSDAVRGSVRADALVQLVGCLAQLVDGTFLDDALADADRRYADDADLDADTTVVLRALLRSVASGEQRRRGDARAAVDAAQEGADLLAGLNRPTADNGQAAASVALRLVHGLLDLGRVDEATAIARGELARPVRAPAAAAIGWLSLAVAVRLHLAAGAPAPALAVLGDAATLAERHRLHGLRAEVLTTLSEAHERVGQLPEALDCLRTAQGVRLRRARAVYAARTKLVSAFGETAAPEEFVPLLGGTAGRRAADRGVAAGREHAAALLDRFGMRRPIGAAVTGTRAAPNTDVTMVLVDLTAAGVGATDPIAEHLAGQVLSRVRDAAPTEARVARVGGAEFAVLLPSTQVGRTERWVDRLRGAMADVDWTTVAPGVAINVRVAVAQQPAHQPAQPALATQRATTRPATTRPAAATQSSVAPEPAFTAEPGFAMQPVSGVGSGFAMQPASGVESDFGTPPAFAAEPGFGTPPASGVEPGLATQPAFAAEPGFGTPPASDVEPGLATQRALAAEAGFAAEPAVAARSAARSVQSVPPQLVTPAPVTTPAPAVGPTPLVPSVFELPTVPIMPVGIGTDPVQRATGRLPVTQHATGAPWQGDPAPAAEPSGGRPAAHFGGHQPGVAEIGRAASEAARFGAHQPGFAETSPAHAGSAQTGSTPVGGSAQTGVHGGVTQTGSTGVGGPGSPRSGQFGAAAPGGPRSGTADPGAVRAGSTGSGQPSAFHAGGAQQPGTPTGGGQPGTHRADGAQTDAGSPSAPGGIRHADPDERGTARLRAQHGSGAARRSGPPGAGQFGTAEAGPARPAAAWLGGQHGSGRSTDAAGSGGQPGSGQPGSGQPGAGQPGAGQPGAGQLGSGQLGAGQLGSGQLGAGQPGAGQPGAGQVGSVPPVGEGSVEGSGGWSDARDSVSGGGQPAGSVPPPILPALPIPPPLEPAHPVSASPVFGSTHPDDVPVSADPSVRISAADISAAGNPPDAKPRHGVAGDTDRSVLASLGITSGSASGGGRRRAKDDEPEENPTTRTRPRRAKEAEPTSRTVSFDDFDHLEPLPSADVPEPTPTEQQAARAPGAPADREHALETPAAQSHRSQAAARQQAARAPGAPADREHAQETPAAQSHRSQAAARPFADVPGASFEPRQAAHGQLTGETAAVRPERAQASLDPFGDVLGASFERAQPAHGQPATDSFGATQEPVADSFGGAPRTRTDHSQPVADSFGESPAAQAHRRPTTADPFSEDRGLLSEHERMAADPFGDWAPLRRDTPPELPAQHSPMRSEPAAVPPPAASPTQPGQPARASGKRRRSVQLADLLTEALMAYQDAQDSNDAKTSPLATDPALPGPTSVPTPLIGLDPAVGDEPGYPGPARHRGEPNPGDSPWRGSRWDDERA